MSLQTIIQGGAIGVLVLVLVGLFLLLRLVAPSIRDFFFGLTADLKANTAALGALRETMLVEVRAVGSDLKTTATTLSARIDLAEERIKAHSTAVGGGVEHEVRDTASKTSEHVARTGQHVALTVGEAVEAIRASRPDDDAPRRPSPPTPIRGFPAIRPLPPPSSRGPGRTVLIVEDDPLQARAIKQCLVAAIGGLIVTLAHNATEAFAALGVTSTALPNVAVIDCNLPDGYGWEVANRTPRSAQIILMSGHVDATMLSKLADGVKALWLRKPLDMDELVGLVRERLDAEG